MAIATVLEGERLGLGVAVISAPEETPGDEAVGGAHDELDAQLRNLANEALRTRSSFERKIGSGETGVRVWVDFRLERPSLGVFGAGDDVQPLVRMAKELGWFVWVADGRSHLVTRERFPTADELGTLPVVDGDGIPLVQWTATFPGFRSRDAVVVMTHSFEQDARILAFLLTLKSPPAYIGVLGPQRRTRELLWAAAGILHLPAHAQAAQVEGWLEKLHAPMGLDLGAESPETIALAVLAEIQKIRTSATALPLREVRAVPVVFSR
jgi:xanthine/CO dehydrogenase XdhC/CoxF family maturation factor